MPFGVTSGWQALAILVQALATIAAGVVALFAVLILFALIILAVRRLRERLARYSQKSLVLGAVILSVVLADAVFNGLLLAHRLAASAPEAFAVDIAALTAVGTFIIVGLSLSATRTEDERKIASDTLEELRKIRALLEIKASEEPPRERQRDDDGVRQGARP